MLYYDRIEVSDGTNVNETSESKDCDICHYRYFLPIGFNFQPNACNRCLDVLMMSLNLNSIVILNINGAEYRCIINGTSRSKVVNLVKKVEYYNHNFSLLCINNV